MSFVKRSITLPVALDEFIVKIAKKDARRRGKTKENFSEAIANLVVEAKEKQLKKGKAFAA